MRTPESCPVDVMGALWDYMGACTARGAASERTRTAYGAAIGLFLGWCQARGLDPRAARERDIEDWRGSMLAAGASAGTVMLRLSAVRTLYKALCRAGTCVVNPAKYVTGPKPAAAPVDSVMAKVVFPDQMIMVLAKIGGDWRGLRDRAVILIFYLLGLTLAYWQPGTSARCQSIEEALEAAEKRAEELHIEC